MNTQSRRTLFAAAPAENPFFCRIRTDPVIAISVLSAVGVVSEYLRLQLLFEGCLRPLRPQERESRGYYRDKRLCK